MSNNELSIEELEINMQIAELAYLSALKKKYEVIFLEDIKGKIINNLNPLFKYYYPNITIDSYTNTNINPLIDPLINTSITIEPYKRMYKELMLNTHPDKNIDDIENANKAFIKLGLYNSNEHITTIKYFYDFIDDDFLLDNIINYVNENPILKEQIKALKISPWYVYHMDEYYKRLFVSNEEYELLQKIHDEIEKVKILQVELDEQRLKYIKNLS